MGGGQPELSVANSSSMQNMTNDKWLTALASKNVDQILLVWAGTIFPVRPFSRKYSYFRDSWT